MQVTTQMGPFSIVPEWVLDRGLSSTALKLYIVLARFADWETGIAFPARDTLAERMQCSEKTVDRAVKELVDAECIEKQFRGRYASARYRVLQVDPRGTKLSAPETELSDEGTKMSARPDKNVHITITTEQEPLEQEPLNDIPKPEKRMTRLPEHWQPDQRLMEMFATKWPDLDADYEVENFINYWLGAGTTKADWDRTFQGWMNRNQRDAKKRPRGQYQERMTNNQKAALLAIQMRQEAEQRKALDAGTNTQQGKELEGEVSSWMKGIDDV